MIRQINRITKASCPTLRSRWKPIRHLPIYSRATRSSQVLRGKSKKAMMMNGLLNRILNGRLLNCILTLFRTDNLSPVNSDTEIITRSGTQSPNIKCKLPSKLTHDLKPLSEVGLPHFQSTKSRQSQILEDRDAFENSRDDLLFPDALPFTARYMSMFTYEGEHGLSTGLAVTDAFIWQLNKVFQCENQVSQILDKIKIAEYGKAELESIMVDLERLLETPLDDEDQRSLCEGRRQALEKIQEYEREIETHETKIQQWNEEKKWPHDQIFDQLKGVLQRNNLLKDNFELNDEEEQDQDMMEGVENQAVTPTPSELAEQESHVEREVAHNLVREARFRLQDAEEKVENSKGYYDLEYSKFKQRLYQSANDTTKTQFDGLMLLEAQEATRELIDAEINLQETMNLAREVGVVFDDFDQESCFADDIDDGYRESWEAHETAHVDRERIESWMQNEKLEYPPECDNWDFKEVDICDSVSLVAEGKERKRIDRWRGMCGLNER